MGVKGQRAWNKSQLDDAQLREWYTTGARSVASIAGEYGITVQAVYWRLEQMGIKRRTNSESHKGVQAREQNPNWRGGRRKKREGYVVVNIGGREEFEHRLVAEQNAGAPSC